MTINKEKTFSWPLRKSDRASRFLWRSNRSKMQMRLTLIRASEQKQIPFGTLTQTVFLYKPRLN